ncbi:hypothetical protein GCM10010533_25630 [Mycolicibacterium pallens]
MAANGLGGIRQASPAASGNEPGVPTAFETRPKMVPDSTGKPSPGGDIRSIVPLAKTPTG